MANNPYVNKVQTADGTTIIDISDTTAVASDVASGKYFYTASGQKVSGTSTGGGGYVTQDENGYIILPSTGGGGYVTQDENGYIILPSTGGGGGSSVQTATGTFTGSGTTTAQISCDFEPDFVYIYGDLTGNVSLRGVVSFTVLKDEMEVLTVDASTSNTTESMYYVAHEITDYGSPAVPHCSYSNGTLTVDIHDNSSSTKFNSSITYSYKLMKWSKE